MVLNYCGDIMNIQGRYDEMIGKLLAISFSFQLSTNFLGAILFNMGISTIYSTYLIYGLFFLQLVGAIFKLRKSCDLNKLVLVYFLIGIIVLVNYDFFPESRIYFRENMQPLLLMVGVYVPVAHLSTRIFSWKPFIAQMKPLSVITPIAGIICYYFLNISQMVTYMIFSNMILPGLLMAWYYYKTERKVGWLVASGIDFFLIIIFGGRMSIFSAIVFAVLLEFYLDGEKKRTTEKLLYLFAIIVVGILAYFYADSVFMAIASIIEKSGYKDSSYIAKVVLKGTLLQSSTRDAIYEKAMYEIQNMGLRVYGLFGDRIRLDTYGHIGSYTTNYVHNIILELLLSFGWILGGICVICLIYYIISRNLSKNHQYSVVVFFFCCVIFLKLMVSGSFLVEGRFPLLLGVLFNKFYRHEETDVGEH